MSNYEIEYRVNGWLDVEADTEEEAKAIDHNKPTSPTAPSSTSSKTDPST